MYDTTREEYTEVGDAAFSATCRQLATEEESQPELVRRKRRWWVRPWLMRRPVYGQYESMMIEQCREHHCDFKSFLRMEPQMFPRLQRVGPSINRENINSPVEDAVHATKVATKTKNFDILDQARVRLEPLVLTRNDLYRRSGPPDGVL
ncbi:hypothetical protein Bbelb_409300 [Branchiostoma belcheri]|nr:hypothetical protein Bbelb_409300 [Branchiostoma belcheri]